MKEKKWIRRNNSGAKAPGDILILFIPGLKPAAMKKLILPWPSGQGYKNPITQDFSPFFAQDIKEKKRVWGEPIPLSALPIAIGSPFEFLGKK
jgi:hypothetical protein